MNWIYSKYICKGDVYLCKIKRTFNGNILNDWEYVQNSICLTPGNRVQCIYSSRFTVINVFCLKLKSTLNSSYTVLQYLQLYCGKVDAPMVQWGFSPDVSWLQFMVICKLSHICDISLENYIIFIYFRDELWIFNLISSWYSSL